MKHIVYTIGSLDNPGGVERVLVNKANFLVQKYKVTIENMIYDKAISRGDRVKVIPLATLKN